MRKDFKKKENKQKIKLLLKFHQEPFPFFLDRTKIIFPVAHKLGKFHSNKSTSLDVFQKTKTAFGFILPLSHLLFEQKGRLKK